MYKQKFVQATFVMVFVMIVGSLQFAVAQNESNATLESNQTAINETMQMTLNVSNMSNAGQSNLTNDSQDNSLTNVAIAASASNTETNTGTEVNTGVNNEVYAANGGANVNTNVNNNVNNNVNTVTVHTNNVQQVNLLEGVNQRLEEIRILLMAQISGFTLNNASANQTQNTTIVNATNVTVPSNGTVTNSTNTTIVNATNATVDVSAGDAIAVRIDRGVGWVLNNDENSFARFAGLEHSFVNANESLEQGDDRHGVAIVRFDNQTYQLEMNINESDADTRVFTIEGNNSGTLTLEKKFSMGKFETWVGSLDMGNMSYGLGFAMIHKDLRIDVEPDRTLRLSDNETLDMSNPEFQAELARIASANFNG